MKPFRLLASLFALFLLAGQGRAETPGAASPAEAHFRDVGESKISFTRDERGEQAAVLIDPMAADAAAADDIEIIELLVSYEPGVARTWRAEQSLDGEFETIFATTGARVRLIGTRTLPDERAYWFATPDAAPVVTALRRLPDPPGAAIAVLRSNMDVVNTLRPQGQEAAR